MSDVENMVEVKDVSMRFNLGIEKGFTLKHYLMAVLKQWKPHQLLEVFCHKSHLLQ